MTPSPTRIQHNFRRQVSNTSRCVNASTCEVGESRCFTDERTQQHRRPKLTTRACRCATCLVGELGQKICLSKSNLMTKQRGWGGGHLCDLLCDEAKRRSFTVPHSPTEYTCCGRFVCPSLPSPKRKTLQIPKTSHSLADIDNMYKDATYATTVITSIREIDVQLKQATMSPSRT